VALCGLSAAAGSMKIKSVQNTALTVDSLIIRPLAARANGYRVGCGAMSDSSPLPTEQNLSHGDRLDSWKEIANYLRRDVRTVQRWEKTERLPVHRHLHEKQGSVYALKSEVDLWASGRRLSDDETDSTTVGPRPEVDNETTPRSAPTAEMPQPSPGWIMRAFALVRRRWWMALLGLALAGA
jgi:hypothetical protein